MRLLVDCISTRTGGGVQVAADIVGKLLQDPAFDVIVVCSPAVHVRLEPKTADQHRSRIEVLASGSWLRIACNAIRMASIQHQFKPQVCYSVFGPSYWLPRTRHVMGFAYGSLVLPRVYARDFETGSLHWIRMDSPLDVVRKWLVRRADVLIAEADTVACALREKLARATQSIHVVPNACSLPEMNVFNVAQISSAIKRILVPATYYPHKNLEIVPHVAANMIMRGAMAFKFELTLPSDAPQWQRIESTARRLGVGGHVGTLGYMQPFALANAYLNSSAVFLPTLIESSTAVYAEAFTYKRPLFTSSRPFAVELCGDAAIYVDPLDFSDCAMKLIETLFDVEKCAALVECGTRALRREYLTPSKRYEQIKEILLSVEKSSA